MRTRGAIALVSFLLFSAFELQGESFRSIVEGSIEITPEKPAGGSVPVGINSSVILNLGPEARFLRGVEIEITAPQAWLPYRGSLVLAVYNNISPKTAEGEADISGSQIAIEPLSPRLSIVYHLPVRQPHGLRTTTSVTVPAGIARTSAFPILIRITPVIKGLSAELENMIFNLAARPILTDEGAVRLIPRFPPRLANRPFTVLINDTEITDITSQIILKEGEHNLVILSDSYKNESRRFIVEKAKVIDLYIDLQDPAPILILEGPRNAEVFLDNARVWRTNEPIVIEPGNHEVRFHVGDYSIIKNINARIGKTYRVSLGLDLSIKEED